MTDMEERMFRARPMSAILDDAFNETLNEFVTPDSPRPNLPIRLEFAHDLREKVTDSVMDYNAGAPAHEQLEVPHELPWYLIAKTIMEYYTIKIGHDMEIESKTSHDTDSPVIGKHPYETGVRYIHIIAREFDPMLSASEMDSLLMYIYDNC